MQNTLCRILRLGIIVATIFFFSPVEPRAADGRDFAGFYESTNVVDQGMVVSLKFSTQIFNYSNSDVFGAYVILDDLLLLEPYMVLQNVNIDYLGQVIVSGDITVPAWEYDQWQRGMRPNLSIIYQDSSGNTISRPVELIQMRLGGQS